jgi:hypothetical protein
MKDLTGRMVLFSVKRGRKAVHMDKRGIKNIQQVLNERVGHALSARTAN